MIKRLDDLPIYEQEVIHSLSELLSAEAPETEDIEVIAQYYADRDQPRIGSDPAEYIHYDGQIEVLRKWLQQIADRIEEIRGPRAPPQPPPSFKFDLD